MLAGDQDIVWPDSLFDIDHLSVSEEAASQTSQGSDGLRGTAASSAQSPVPSGTGGTGRDFWDHDDRGMSSNRYAPRQKQLSS